MKAVRLCRDATGFELRDEPVPTPGPREVLVRMHAASLNFRDIAIVKGQYPGVFKKDAIPLSDGAGEVIAVGDEVTRAKVGDRVTSSCNPYWINGPYLPEYQSSSPGITVDGVLAEQVTMNENGLVQIPDYMSYAEAAAMPCAAVSAWTALHVATPLRPGQTVLIQGTGGVALFGLQIARMFGARVLAITSTDEKAETLKAMGADAVVNYRSSPEWQHDILALTDGVGVDKVLEVAGDATIVKSVASSRIGGEIGLVGFVSGFGGGLPPIDILKRSVTIKGIGIGPRTSFEALLAAMAVSKVRPVTDKVYPFAEHAEAYRRLESGDHIGKVIVDVAG